MDPLSISASIIAVLQLTATVVQYLTDVKDYSKDRERLRSELCGIDSMLCVLKNKATQAQQGDSWSMTLQSLCVANGPLEQFKATLERLAKKLVPPKGSKRVITAVTWPFQKGEVSELLNSVERQKTLFAFAQQNDHIALSKAIKGDVMSIRNELGRLETAFTRLQHNEQQGNFLYSWLKPPDPSVNHNKALKERFGKTGTWFTESLVANNWKTAPGSFLWLYGIPGCGKTILSSTIIEAIFNHCSNNSFFAVVYFYFDFNDAEKQRPESMIRSLIVQLSLQCISVPQTLESLYTTCTNGKRQPAQHSLLATLHQVIEGFQETYLVIDALDESSDRNELLANIEKMTSWKDLNLHTLVTSRKEKDILDSMERLADQEKVCIQSILVNDDICAYVRGRLQTDLRLKRWRNQPKVQLEIESTLMDKADGMFRWAVCQLDSLGNCLNLPGLRKALASLPKTLDETYTRILCSIDEDHYKYALKILQWLTYSLQPLELKQVAETVAIDIEGSPRFDPENRLPEPLEIVTICASLISLDDQNDENESKTIVRLAHFSVKEYLISRRIRQSDAKQYSIREIDANISIYSDCIVYIMDADGCPFPDDELLTEYPLALYAMRYWTRHARVAESDPSFGSDLIKEFFTRRDGFVNRICLAGQLSVFAPMVPLGFFVFSEMKDAVELGDICPPLHFASLAGLYKVVEILLEEGADVHAQSKKYGYALPVIASMEQCYDVSENGLLDYHAQSKKYGYALPLMISMAQCYDVSEPRLLELVQMFLARGVHVDPRSGSESGSTALYLACFHGYDRVVQLLLDNGADLNAKGLPYGNALRAASSGGHHRIVKVLLEAGADIDGAFLPEPCRKGHSQVVQILLDKGADINAQTNIRGPALYEASAEGDVQIVRMLLEKGADVNARNNRDSLSALQVAAARGYNRVVESLLANGAEATGALQEATGWGHEETARVLLLHGVDVNNAESEYGSALLVALVVGHYRIAKTLLDHEADIRAEGGFPIAHYALEDALTFYDEYIAELLFKRGAQRPTRAVESDPKQLYERHRARIAEAFHPRKRFDYWEF